MLMYVEVKPPAHLFLEEMEFNTVLSLIIDIFSMIFFFDILNIHCFQKCVSTAYRGTFTASIIMFVAH